jgi:hypothetical protein
MQVTRKEHSGRGKNKGNPLKGSLAVLGEAGAVGVQELV